LPIGILGEKGFGEHGRGRVIAEEIFEFLKDFAGIGKILLVVKLENQFVVVVAEEFIIGHAFQHKSSPPIWTEEHFEKFAEWQLLGNLFKTNGGRYRTIDRTFELSFSLKS
jgi:hypothetical protein